MASSEPKSWNILDVLDQTPTFAVMAETICELIDEGEQVAALTADLKYSNGFDIVADRRPERFFNMGISEQNMVSTAAGMATAGWMPFVAEFASFLPLLCCEQIRTDVAYSQLPVRLIGHHAGISMGFYGTSHHATEDLSITRAIAGLTVFSPSDASMLRVALRSSLAHSQPIYFRLGRGRDPVVYAEEELAGFEFGRAIELHRGSAGTVIAIGSMVAPAKRAVEALRAGGLDVGLLDLHTLKPFDSERVLELASSGAPILTVEEHNVIGGLGAAVCEVVASEGLGTRVVRHGIADEYSLIGPPKRLYQHYRLDADGIEAVAREAFEGT